MHKLAILFLRVVCCGFLAGVFAVAHPALTQYGPVRFWLHFVCLSVAFVGSLVLLAASFIPMIARGARGPKQAKPRLDAHQVASIMDARRRGEPWNSSRTK